MTEITKNDKNDEDNSDSYKQGIECWIRGNHGNHRNDKNHRNLGANHGFPKQRVLKYPISCSFSFAFG